MSGQVSRGSAGEYQADERAGVARACALRHKVLLTRAADWDCGARLAPTSRDLRPQFFRPVRPFLRVGPTRLAGELE